MSDELFVEVVNPKPVARRICAQDGAYPWGDGIAPNSFLKTDGGQNGCNPVSPNRNPSKWPNNLDWRNPAFMPWSQRTATPSPAGYEGLFVVTDPSSPWPDHTDSGKVVRLYPSVSPDEATLGVRWQSVGLQGGTVYADTSYVQAADATDDEPARSLLVRSGANTDDGSGNDVQWQGERFVFETFDQYRGDFEYFGPLPIRNLVKTKEPNGGCSSCKEVEYRLFLPEMGIGSPKPGGFEISQINGAELSFDGDNFVSCFWGRNENGLLPEALPDSCTPGFGISWSWNCLFEWNHALSVCALSLSYGAGLLGVDPTDGCGASRGFQCCRDVYDIYNIGEPYADFGSYGYSANYVGALAGPLDCLSQKTLLGQVNLGIIDERGQPWAGRFGDTIILRSS